MARVAALDEDKHTSMKKTVLILQNLLAYACVISARLERQYDWQLGEEKEYNNGMRSEVKELSN